VIESRRNKYIKDIRRLKRHKGDHLLLEGPHLVSEAVDGGLELEIVLATPRFLSQADPALLAGFGPPPLEISPSLLEELTDADSPRGVLAVARLPRGGATTLPRSPAGIYLYLAGLQDPGNLGAIARAAEATGAAGLALSPGSVHPNHPRSLRASAGSLLRLPVAVDVSPHGLADHLRPLEPAWVALTPDGEHDIYRSSLTPPLVLVIGAERGLSPELADRCDRRLQIPMAAPVDSLNTAVAAALTLFEIRRQAQRPPLSSRAERPKGA